MHSHGAQWAVILEGEIELLIDGVHHVFRKGDRYFIPAGVDHSAFVHAGCADINWFETKDRYRAKPQV